MAYGDALYGALLFGGQATDISQPSDVTPPDLMGYLPAYWHGIRDMVELQATLAEELGISIAAAADLAHQFYATTATWGLSYWERELGLPTDPSMTYAWRREIIRAKLRGHGTVTRQMLIGVASAFSGGEVNVQEYPSDNRFVIQFVGILGVPANMAGFIAMLEQIKPAHLSYTFLYTYTTWERVSHLTWHEAAERSWAQLRTFGGG